MGGARRRPLAAGLAWIRRTLCSFDSDSYLKARDRSRADRTAYRQGKCALAAGDASGRHLALLALAPRCACRAPDILWL